MDSREEMLKLISSALSSNKLVSIIDRDVASFGYMLGLEAIKEDVERGKYVWVASYDPLRNLFWDMDRIGIDYEEHIGKNLLIFDVFGSIKGIEPEIDGVFTLKGYLDDNVFILKYQKLISEVIESLRPRPKEVTVLGHLESGLCRLLFKNPIRVQKKAWDLIRGVPLKLSIIKTYILPECPPMDELVYFRSDLVIEGFVEKDRRKLIVTKGGENEP